MPGGKVCSIAVCKNNESKIRERGEQHLIFFSFPKDPKFQTKWKKKCDQNEDWDCTYKRICSQHFELDDYEDKLQAELLNIPPKKLKKDAIPSLFLHSTQPTKPSRRLRRILPRGTKVAKVTISQKSKKTSTRESSKQTTEKPDTTCSITTCTTSSRDSGRNFYPFPTENIMQKKWVKQCYGNRKVADIKNKRICSKHFIIPDDLDDGDPKKLKATAIPTRNLPLKNNIVTSTKKKAKTLKIDEHNNLNAEKQATEENKTGECNENLMEDITEDNSINYEMIQNQARATTISETPMLVIEDGDDDSITETSLLHKYNELLKENEELKAENASLRKNVKQYETNMDLRIEAILSNYLPPVQIKILLERN